MLPSMPPVARFSDQQLEAIAQVLGEALTGSQITRVLRRAEIYKDVTPDATKWKRLLTAFTLQQRSDGHGTQIARAIEVAMDPIGYANAPQRFAAVRDGLNRVLAFCGMELGDDGRLRPVAAAATLTEAQRRARSLYQALAARGAHREVLRYCTAELLEDNYFHAVLEAIKGLFDRLRRRTGLTADGHALIDQALALPKDGGAARVAFNSLRGESERSEQTGLAFLFKGIASAFRNPTAHEARITWPLGEQDALDLLGLVSMLHRRLDTAVDVPRKL
jgi:uncharacterized protein (TIGR02391 family)